jgi:hypothetical protein
MVQPNSGVRSGWTSHVLKNITRYRVYNLRGLLWRCFKDIDLPSAPWCDTSEERLAVISACRSREGRRAATFDGRANDVANFDFAAGDFLPASRRVRSSR